MRLLPDGTYQITNNSTGQTKIVKPEELSQYGLQAPSAPAPVQPQTPVTPQAPAAPDPSTFQPSFLDSVKNTAVSIGKGIANGPLRLGDALGNAAALAPSLKFTTSGDLNPIDAIRGKGNSGNIHIGLEKSDIQKNQEATQQTYRDTADRLSTQAAMLARAGKKDEANKLYALAQESLAKAGGAAADISNQADKSTEDLVKGGVGTAALFAPTVGGLLPQIGVGAAAGAASGFGASSRGNELGDTAKGALIGGTVAGTLNVAGKVKNALSGSGAKLAAEGQDVTQGIRQIKVKPTVGGAQQEQAINQTLDDLGIKGTPQQQYEQLQPVMKDLTKKINTHLDSSTASEPIKPLVDSLEQKIQSTTNFDPEIQGYQKWNNHFMGQVKQTANADGVVTPKDLFTLKQKIADQIPKAFEKDALGTVALTPKEEMGLATWHNIDDMITQIDPTVKDLTTQQSMLYKSAKSLSAARSNPPTLRAAGFSIPARATIAGQQIAGNTLQGVGGAMQKAGSLPSIPAGISPFLSATLPSTASVVQNGQQPQDAGNTQPTDQVSNTEQNTANQLPPISDQSTISQQKTLNQYGATPEVIYREYQNAQNAGDTKTASRLRTMYEDEVAYQKTQNGAGKSLSSTGAKTITDIQSGQQLLKNLDSAITKYSGKMGPARGGFTGANKYDTDAQAFQAQVNLAAQVVGKALEGGKLTDQDIARYQNILPNINDMPAAARVKLKTIQRMMDNQLRLSQQNFAGAVDTALPPIQ